MKKASLFILILSLLLTVFSSCDLWEADLIEFLEYYSTVAGIGRHELDGSYPSVSGVTHIAGDKGQREIEFIMRNPKRFSLDFSIVWKNKPLGETEPQYGVDYTFKQDPYDIMTMTLTEDFLAKLDGNPEYGDISAAISLAASDTGREFETYSYKLIVNSAPPQAINAQFAKATTNGRETWWLCFNAPVKEGIHPDIETITIDDTVYTYDDSRFIKVAPSGLKDTLRNDFSLSGDIQRYINTEIDSNVNLSSTITVTDSRGLSSSAVTVNTGDIPLVTSPVINTNGVLDSAKGNKTVTLSSLTTGATIYYTTNGNTPTTSSTKYTTPFTVNIKDKNVTVKAKAIRTGMKDSSVVSHTFLQMVATPIISASTADGNGNKKITISSATSGATMYYTTDDTLPATTASGSTKKYTGAFSQDVNKDGITVKAIAIKEGMTNSDFARYEVTRANAVNTPTFTTAFAGLEVPSGTELEITSDGAEKIYYNAENTAFDNDNPSATGWVLYEASNKPQISFPDNDRYYAIATADGKANSGIVEAIYTQAQIPPPTIIVNEYFRNQTSFSITSNPADAIIEFSTDRGARWNTYTSAVQITETTTIIAKATKAGWIDSVTSEPVTSTERFLVTFNPNGGTGSMSQQTFTDGVASNLYNENFNRTGYSFAGWALSENDPVVYDNRERLSITEDMTLYAKWTADSYTLSFNTNGGTGTAEAKNVTYDSAIDSLPSLSKEGYAFDGWKIGSATISDGTKWTYTRDQTAIAQWSLEEYTVTFNSNGGSGDTPVADWTVENRTIAHPTTAPTKTTGNTLFVGWSEDSSNNESSRIVFPYEATDTGNKTLYAIWVNASKYTTFPSGTYTEESNGTVSITNGESFSGAVNIPPYINGKPVTSISEDAFQYNYDITAVTIPNSVTTIESDVFQGCSSLTSVDIPASVTYIGYEAFYRCTKLTSIIVNIDNPNYKDENGILYTKDGKTLMQYLPGKTDTTTFEIPNSVTSIAHGAFAYSSGLISVTIPHGVTSIERDAFAYCSSLTSVTIPNSVTSIKSRAFLDTSLARVDIPASVTEMEGWAFGVCTDLVSINVDTNNPNYKDVNGILYTKNGEILMRYPMGKTDTTTFEIPNGVTEIESGAFDACSHLTSVTIPDSVKTIGTEAFDGCRGLKSISIPNSVTLINSVAFRNCSGLTSVIFGDSLIKIGGNAFISCSKLTSVTIPVSVKEIGYGAFEKCTSLTGINVAVTEANKPDDWHASWDIKTGSGDRHTVNWSP